MKAMFQSKPLHLTACILLFWKGISLFVGLLLRMADMPKWIGCLFYPTGFVSAFALGIVAAFAEVSVLIVVLWALLGVAFLAYWVFFVLLARNRSGAGFASVGLLVLCALDLPITVLCSLGDVWLFLACFVFHTALFIVLVLLRRSRPGTPVPLSKPPASI